MFYFLVAVDAFFSQNILTVLLAFEVEEDPASKTFFSEIIASVSDAKFSPDGKYILSRDYMTLKIWDIKMENRPLKVLNIHEPLRSKLCDLYENDCIFDKFECCFSGDGNNVLTGSYKNHLHIFDKQGKTHSHIEASTSPAIAKKKAAKTSILGRKKKTKDDTFETADFSKKCLHLAWHPQENIIAVSSVNSLYIFAS
jgi:serine/threonine-protein phosphatase 2A regulatory subunit B